MEQNEQSHLGIDCVCGKFIPQKLWCSDLLRSGLTNMLSRDATFLSLLGVGRVRDIYPNTLSARFIFKKGRAEFNNQSYLLIIKSKF